MIDFLAGDQRRTNLHHVVQPLEIQVRCLVGTLISHELALGVNQLRFAALASSLGLRIFIRHLRNFQGGDQLPRLHAISYIHADVLQVSGHLGVQIYFFVGSKLG